MKTTAKKSIRPKSKALDKQQGVVLLIALIMLVAMTMAGVALVRSVDTTTMIAGNLAFKQSATSSGDRGVETAIAWLTTNAGSLEADNTAGGYYAASQDCLDLTGNGSKPSASCTPPYTALDWDANAATLSADAVGNKINYVIHRMCDAAGPLDGGSCATEQDTQAGSSTGGVRQMTTYQPGTWATVANRGYYRITVRVSGPRDNMSYVQTFVSL
ncbi:MAG: hypothetical protein Q8O37_04025 [Sulfuricellaceae bacterium]|nr:hypothetical protein [Sulfuricellaceae bacterium]